jgi:acetylornithine deacetylase/succinyl-diaminopimelate desuccinylase-like protein
MVDRDGQLLVPGAGYAEVKVDAADLAAVRALPVDHAGFVESVGVEPTTGKDDALFHERLMLRPAFNVSGFASGYTGQGSKTIIFKEAIAKADVRLVGGQDPDQVFEAIVKFAKDRGYHGIEITSTKGTPASRTPLDHPIVGKVKEAVAKGFGRHPLVVPSLGGTTPDFVFTRILGLPRSWSPSRPTTRTTTRRTSPRRFRCTSPESVRACISSTP